MNREIIEMLCADDSFKIEDTEQLRRELESEMLKSEPDIDLVEELVSLIMLSENLPSKSFDTASEYHKITTRKRKKTIPVFIKRTLIAASMILLIGNIVTFTAYGEDLFTVITHIGRYINIDFTEDNGSPVEHTDTYDQYGIKKLFEEEGHYIEAPMYLPDGYRITEYRKEATPILDLSDGKGKVCISFMFYESDEEVRDFSILEEKSTDTEITVNGHTGYFIETEKGDFLTYRFENTIAVYSFIDIDKNEIRRIINSIK